MRPENLGWIKPAPRERQPGSSGLGEPQIPDLKHLRVHLRPLIEHPYLHPSGPAESSDEARCSSTVVEVWTDDEGHLLTDPWPQRTPLHGATKDGVPIMVKVGRRELRVL